MLIKNKTDINLKDIYKYIDKDVVFTKRNQMFKIIFQINFFLKTFEMSKEKDKGIDKAIERLKEKIKNLNEIYDSLEE